jgi:hypothetical protein
VLVVKKVGVAVLTRRTRSVGCTRVVLTRTTSGLWVVVLVVEEAVVVVSTCRARGSGFGGGGDDVAPWLLRARGHIPIV